MQMRKLTVKGFLCQHFTPLSHSSSRHSSHSNIVFSTRKKCRQKGRSWIRLSAHSIVPVKLSITSVFNLILQEICNILESNPGHSQTWVSIFHVLGYRNTSNVGKDLQNMWRIAAKDNAIFMHNHTIIQAHICIHIAESINSIWLLDSLATWAFIDCIQCMWHT